jgi:hypothetical protein
MFRGRAIRAASEIRSLRDHGPGKRQRLAKVSQKVRWPPSLSSDVIRPPIAMNGPKGQLTAMRRAKRVVFAPNRTTQPPALLSYLEQPHAPPPCSDHGCPVVVITSHHCSWHDQPISFAVVTPLACGSQVILVIAAALRSRNKVIALKAAKPWLITAVVAPKAISLVNPERFRVLYSHKAFSQSDAISAANSPTPAS